MDGKSGHDVNPDNGRPSASIVELFHMVKSLIPDGQEVITVTPDTSVAEAVSRMKDGDYSQLPVVSGNAVLGVFSYRSLAQNLLGLGPIDTDFRSLPVDEFMEWFTFVQPTNKWESILEILNREDGVLVGNRDDLQGVLTSMDVLVYLHRLASPFVMLAEIELSLRRIIESCVDAGELTACAVNSLSAKYTVEDMPTSPSSMTFNDYVQIIGDGRNWPQFEPAFGSGGWLRKKTVARLTEVRDLRNDTFHFKRQLDVADYATLAQHRDWLEMKTRSFEGRQRQPEDESEPSRLTSQKKTTRSAMLSACNTDAAPFLSWMLDQADAHNMITSWGTKGFSLRVQLPSRKASFAYGYPPNLFQAYLVKNLGLPEAEELKWRQELLAFGVLQESGQKTLRAEINPGNESKLRDVFTCLMKRVVALARYPLSIQASVEGKIVTAKLLDEGGRVRFEGTEYGSVSGAAKVASGWIAANGWTFWQYFDELSREWRPIDDLRKQGDET